MMSSADVFETPRPEDHFQSEASGTSGASLTSGVSGVSSGSYAGPADRPKKAPQFEQESLTLRFLKMFKYFHII